MRVVVLSFCSFILFIQMIIFTVLLILDNVTCLYFLPVFEFLFVE